MLWIELCLVACSVTAENVLMPQVKGEWPNCFEPLAKQQKTNNHLLQFRYAKKNAQPANPWAAAEDHTRSHSCQKSVGVFTYGEQELHGVATEHGWTPQWNSAWWDLHQSCRHGCLAQPHGTSATADWQWPHSEQIWPPSVWQRTGMHLPVQKERRL